MKPNLRLLALSGSTVCAWMLAALAIGTDTAWLFYVAAAINGAGLVTGIWTPPPAWPRAWSQRIAVGATALACAASFFLMLIGLTAHRP